MIVEKSRTVIESLRERASLTPERTAFRVLRNGEEEAESITFESLNRRVNAIAERVGELCPPQSRVLLFLGTGIESVAAVLGCIAARMIPVPCLANAGSVGIERLEAVANDCHPHLLMTCGHAAMRRSVAQTALRFPTLDTSDIADSSGKSSVPVDISPNDVALLQYTSGSTSSPKGVVVSHRNLMANLAMIQEAFRQTPESRVVSWLPLHHDMGLVGTVLQTVFTGTETILMSPGAFIRDPVVWLKAISRYRATTSGGPDFGYRLCSRRIREEEAARLDLSSWEVAFNGSEPVQHATLEEFSSRFAPYGFHRRSFQPCYGLAEATLFVAGRKSSPLPQLLTLDAEGLRGGRVIEGEPGTDATMVISSCGLPALGSSVVILNPDSEVALNPDQIGEICVAGVHVSPGYYAHHHDATSLLGGIAGGGILRTGDLGFVYRDELYVTGRIKDLLIVHGRNHYPQDLERTITRSCKELTQVTSAVFSCAEEKIVAVLEISANLALRMNSLASSARDAIAREHELRLDTVVFVREGSIPRTTSGKLRRQACRSLYEGQGLQKLGENSLGGPSSADLGELTATVLEATDPIHRVLTIERYLQAVIEKITGSPISLEASAASAGLDSLRAATLKAEIDQELRVSFPLARLLAGTSLAQLARELSDLVERGQDEDRPESATPSPAGALSPEQERLWMLQAMDPASTALNLVGIVRIRGVLDSGRLASAIASVVRCHPALRTRFEEGAIGPLIAVDDSIIPRLERTDSAILIEEGVNEELTRFFDLRQSPLIRFRLAEYSSSDHVLFVTAHHIIFDAWSFQILIKDLADSYDGCTLSSTTFFWPGQAQEKDDAYWREKLSKQAMLPQLPPGIAAGPGDAPAHSAFTLDSDAALQLTRAAMRVGVTLFSQCLAVFAAVFGRMTRQSELTLAVPVSGREPIAMQNTIGLLAHPTLVSIHLAEKISMEELSASVREEVIAAVQHQSTPFSRLLELARFPRTGGRFRIPVLFSMLPPLETLYTADAVRLELEAIYGGDQDVDMLVAIRQVGSELRFWVQYRKDRVEERFAEELWNAFTRTLTAATTSPAAVMSVLESIVPPHSPVDNSHPLVIAATFTADPVRASLEFWRAELSSPLSVSFAPYGQIFQQMMGRDSEFAMNRDGTNVCLIRLSDLCATGKMYGADVESDLIEAVRFAASQHGCPLIVIFASSHSLAVPQLRFMESESRLATAILQVPGVTLVTSIEIQERYPVALIEDAESDALGHIPFTDEYYAAVGTSIIRALYGLYVPSPKLIAADCDQTLWSGVCAEEGPMGVVLDQNRLEFQRFLVEQHASGRLIAICSKNHPDDVQAVFDQRRDMELRQEHISAARVSWESKSSSLRHLAATFSLGLDSFVFIDDNPAECAEVRANCPGVLAIQLLGGPQSTREQVNRIWAFDRRGPVTAEASRRAELYRREAARTESRTKSSTMLSFIRSLDVQASFSETRDTDLARASELTFRTNQFNLNGTRWNVPQIRAWDVDPSRLSFIVGVSDRFGDYGVVGFLACSCAEGTLIVDSWVLSCRVLGRGVEFRIVEHLGQIAYTRGLSQIEFDYRPTSRNEPANLFLKECCGPTTPGMKANIAVHAALTAYERGERMWSDEAGVPFSDAQPASVRAEVRRHLSNSLAGADLIKIAERLYSPSLVIAAMRAGAKTSDSGGLLPRTATERAVAELWDELLNVENPSVDRDFFELGGSSVVAMRMLAEIRRRFLVDLPITAFFDDEVTICVIAAAIDRARSVVPGKSFESVLEIPLSQV